MGMLKFDLEGKLYVSFENLIAHYQNHPLRIQNRPDGVYLNKYVQKNW